ncbi:MAG: lytic transglycosylase domain-containing protein [Bacteroidales bacterium]|nr:lytic transglycosylase domain-containing protein [Bacteroidales bacterium]
MRYLRIMLFCFCGAVSAVLLLLLFSGGGFSSGENPEHLQAFSEHYRLYSPPIPDSLSFAGEPVPLDRVDVREALDRELLVNDYWQSNLLLLVKRSNRWFPVMEPVLASNGVPDDFKYLALIESGLMNVVSPSKAAGFWQFLKATAQSYGLEVNDNVDERYDVAKATAAACAYLKDSKAKCGSWTAAAAGYNMGYGGYAKAAAAQHTSSYWDLYLNAETARYVYRILAVKLILKNPEQYGVRLRQRDLYPPLEYDTLLVDSSIADLRLFAIQQGTSYKWLKESNPWLRSTTLPNASKKEYLLLVPKKGSMSYRQQLRRMTPDAMYGGR